MNIIKAPLLDFSTLITQSLICLEHGWASFPMPLKVIIIFIGNLQPLAFIIQDSQEDVEHNTDLSFVPEAINLIRYITFPQWYLYKIYSEEKYHLQENSYILVLLWILVLILLLITINYVQQNPKHQYFNIEEKLKVLPSIVRLIAKYMAFTSSIQISYLFAPFSLMCIQGIRISVNQNKMTANLFFQILTLISFCSFIVLKLIISEETLNLKFQGFQRLNITSINLMLLILRFGQLVVYTFKSIQQVQVYFQIACFIFIQLLQIWLIIISDQIQNRLLVKTSLIISSFNFNILIGHVILNVDIQRRFEENGAISLLTFMILAKLMIQIEQKWYLSNLTQLKDIKKSNKLQVFFVANLLNQSENLNDQENFIWLALILKSHRESCNDSICICRQDGFIRQTPTRSLLLSDEIEIQYTKRFLKKLNKSLRSVKQDNERFSFAIHIIAAMTMIGMNTQAFLQINQIRNEKRIFLIKHDKQIKIATQQSRSQSISAGTIFSKIQYQQQLHNKIDKQLKAINLQPFSYLSVLNQIKLKLLQEQVKHQINRSFHSSSNINNSTQADDIAYAVALFIDQEKGNTKLQNKILSILQEKLRFYQLSLTSKDVTSEEIYDTCYNQVKNMKMFEEKLIKIYQTFPSQKIQSVLGFYYGDLINSYLQAYKISNVMSIADDKLMRLHKNLSIDIFSKHTTYLLVALNQKGDQMDIQSKSSKANEFFGYSREDFAKLSSFDQLLPPYIRDDHQYFVKQFLITGKSKFFRRQNDSFCMMKNNFVYPIELLYDINFQSVQEFSFATFLQKSSMNKAFIIVDWNFQVGGISKQFLELFGFKKNEIDMIDQQELLYSISITDLIPEFENIIRAEPANHEERFQELQVQFLKRNLVLKNFIKGLQPQITINSVNESRKRQLWKSMDSKVEYSCRCNLEYRNIFELSFYIIDFEHIRETNRLRIKEDEIIFDKTVIEDRKSLIYSSDICEKIEKRSVKYSDDSEWDDLIELDNQINIQVEEVYKPHADNVQKVKLIYKQSLKKLESSETPTFLKIKTPSGLLSPQVYLGQSNMLSPSGILSPNASMSQIVGPKNESHLFLKQPEHLPQNQQRFYYLDQQESNNDSNVQENTLNEEQTEKNQFQNEFQAEIISKKEQILINDKGSDVSSVAGIRKSAFYRKYEIIIGFIQTKKDPQELYLTTICLVFSLTIGIIACIITIGNVSSDLQVLLNQINMLQITNYFMAPFAQFTLERFGINRYDEMLTFNYFNQTEHMILVNYLKPLTISSFDNAKDRYTQQIENQYLQPFFRDNYVMVTIGYNSSNQDYNVTFREALQMLIQVQWLYKLALMGIIDRKFIRTLPVYYFQYANLPMFVEKCRSIDKNILDYIKENCHSVQDKWTSIFSPFLIIVFTFASFAWLNYVQFIKKQERILQMFRLFNSSHVEIEIERMKVLISLLQKNDNIVFNYKFNLDQKERQLLKIQSAKSAKHQQVAKLDLIGSQINKNFSNIKLSKVKSLLIILCMISYFVISFSAVVAYNRSFLVKFSQTSEFFKDLSDMGFNIPFVYICREMLFNLTAVPLNSSNVNKTYGLLEDSLNGLQSFVKLSIFFKQSDYLLTDSFLVEWQKAQSESLCQFVPSSIKENTTYYCETCFAGALQRGLQISIHTIFTELQTEMAINNFTVRTQWPYIEFEGAFVAWNTTDSLTITLKQSIQDVTNAWIEIIRIICVSCIILHLSGILISASIGLRIQCEKFWTLKKIIYLMPPYLIYAEDQFERYLKLIASKDELI